MFFLSQVGLFRKSGAKSRIQYLRELVDSDPDGVSYDGQSAFDVADMVKQYFRDLPEPIFTSKLCESFLHIYQCERPLLPLSCQRATHNLTRAQHPQSKTGALMSADL